MSSVFLGVFRPASGSASVGLVVRAMSSVITAVYWGISLVCVFRAVAVLVLLCSPCQVLVAGLKVSATTLPAVFSARITPVESIQASSGAR